jgi:hypothetical protein
MAREGKRIQRVAEQSTEQSIRAYAIARQPTVQGTPDRDRVQGLAESTRLVNNLGELPTVALPQSLQCGPCPVGQMVGRFVKEVALAQEAVSSSIAGYGCP